MMVALPESPDLVLQKDDALRKMLFGEEVMRHPAKQSIHQLMHLSRRARNEWGIGPYATMLDVFGGSGTAMLLTSPMYGAFNVVTIELAAHFQEMEARAWGHLQQSWVMLPQHGLSAGDFVCLPGDSRKVAEVISAANGDASAMADLIITSPSYGGSEAVDRRKKQNSTIANHAGGNLARLRYDRDELARNTIHDEVDLIVTSPPYEGTVSNTTDQTQRLQEKEARLGKSVFLVKPGPNSQGIVTHSYDTTAENIGNQRGKKYLESMRDVWTGCAEVLRPGGILCCITRDCVRNGKRVPVGQQNHDLLIEAGLAFIEREIWQIPQLSFWRILQQRKNPNTPLIDTEDVYIFRKP